MSLVNLFENRRKCIRFTISNSSLFDVPVTLFDVDQPIAPGVTLDMPYVSVLEVIKSRENICLVGFRVLDFNPEDERNSVLQGRLSLNIYEKSAGNITVIADKVTEDRKPGVYYAQTEFNLQDHYLTFFMPAQRSIEVMLFKGDYYSDTPPVKYPVALNDTVRTSLYDGGRSNLLAWGDHNSDMYLTMQFGNDQEVPCMYVPGNSLAIGLEGKSSVEFKDPESGKTFRLRLNAKRDNG